MGDELDTYRARVLRFFTHLLSLCLLCPFGGCVSGLQVVKSPQTAQINGSKKSGLFPLLRHQTEHLLQEAAIRFEAQDYKGVIDILHPVLSRPNLLADQKRRALLFVAEAAWQQEQFLLAWPLYESLAKQETSVIRQTQLSKVTPSQSVWGEIARVRLMQMADSLGQWQQAASFYTAYAKQHTFIPTLLHYLQGKAAFHLRQNRSALHHLALVPQNSPYFQRARYLMATVHVRVKNWQAASQQFHQITQGSRVGIHRVVYEKALLALARLSYRQKKWGESIAFYKRVPVDSSQYAWALYEQALAFQALADVFRQKGQQEHARTYYKTSSQLLHKLHHLSPNQYAHPKVQLLLADIARKEGLRTRAEAIYKTVLETYQPIYADLSKVDKQPAAVQRLYESSLFLPPADIAGQYRAVQELQSGFDLQSKKQHSSQHQAYNTRVRAIKKGIHLAWAPLLQKDLGQLLRWARAGIMHLQIVDKKRWQKRIDAVQKQRAIAIKRSNNVFDGV